MQNNKIAEFIIEFFNRIERKAENTLQALPMTEIYPKEKFKVCSY